MKKIAVFALAGIMLIGGAFAHTAYAQEVNENVQGRRQFRAAICEDSETMQRFRDARHAEIEANGGIGRRMFGGEFCIEAMRERFGEHPIPSDAELAEISETLAGLGIEISTSDLQALFQRRGTARAASAEEAAIRCEMRRGVHRSQR